jgi:hypothetical protein
VVDHKEHRQIRAIGHDRQGPVCSRLRNSTNADATLRNLSTKPDIVPAKFVSAPAYRSTRNFSLTSAFLHFNVTLGATNAQLYIPPLDSG